jgi:hypothetical protein
MKRSRSAAMIAVAAVATVGLGAGAAITACAHGLVVTAGQARFSWMPMMTASPAFRGSAL